MSETFETLTERRQYLAQRQKQLFAEAHKRFYGNDVQTTPDFLTKEFAFITPNDRKNAIQMIRWNWKQTIKFLQNGYYRRLALLVHPDKNKDDELAATTAFQQLQHLSNSNCRT